MSCMEEAEENYQLEYYFEKEILDNKSSEDFLNYILDNSNPSLNNIVPNGKFNAYDIADKLRKNKWKPTAKQRLALTNVFLEYTMYRR